MWAADDSTIHTIALDLRRLQFGLECSLALLFVLL